MTNLTKFLYASAFVATVALCVALRVRTDAPNSVHIRQTVERPAVLIDSSQPKFGSVTLEAGRQFSQKTTSDRLTAIGAEVEATADKRVEEVKRKETDGIEISVPTGVHFPVALLQNNEGTTESSEFNQARMGMVDHLAMDFASEIAAGDATERMQRKQSQEAALPNGEGKFGSSAPVAPAPASASGGNEDPAVDRWNAAKIKADRRFRALFGDVAYNREQIRQFSSQAGNH